MGFLFWLMWTIDLLIALFAIWGMNFRSSFGAGVLLNQLIIIGVVAVLIGSLILRLGYKLKMAGLVVAAIPLLIGLIAYLIDVIKNP